MRGTDGQQADTWKRNALFRVLAFLDNTGVQTFDLAEDTTGAHGEFTHGSLTFGEGTAATAIMHSVLAAARANVIRLFANAEEQHAFLQLLGTGGSASDHAPPHAITPLAQMEVSVLAETATAPTSDAASPAADSATTVAVPLDGAVAGAQRRDSASAGATELAEALLRPVSLLAASRTVEETLPLHLYSRLADVLGVPPPEQGSSRGASPLLEQLIIDGLDHWMTGRTLDANRQLVLACGVQPSLVDQVCARPLEEATRLFVDFVVDVVFPPPHAGDTTGDGDGEDQPGSADTMLDWLLLSYEKNHETVEVDDEESDASEPLRDGTSSAAQGEAGLDGWTPEEGEVVLTEDNIDEYMRTHPEWIPIEVMREKRRAWTDAAITAFELSHHYALAELKSAVTEVAKASEDAAARSALEASLAHVIPSAALSLARRARKKADLVEALLALHATTVQGNEHAPPPCDATLSPPSSAPREAEPASGGDVTVDTSLSAKEMEKRYTLAQLKDGVSAHLPDHPVPATKQKCVKLLKTHVKNGDAV